MRHREKIQQELNRRLEEVTWYRDIQITEQDSAKDFFGRVADYVNYAKVNRQLSNYLGELENERKSIKIDKDLEKEGNDLLGKMQKDFQTVNDIIIRNKIEIKPFVPVSGTLSEMQAISLTHLQLEEFLKRGTRYVGDIPSHIGELWSLNGHIDGLVSYKDKGELKTINESYYSVRDRLQEKLRLQSNWISFLRFDAYERLMDAWSYYFDSLNPHEFSLLRVELGEILGWGITMPTLSPLNTDKVQDRKNEYLLIISRFHNYLIDKLEEKSWLEEALIWFWENFGKVIVSMVLSLLLVYLLKSLGFTVPVDLINGMLSR